MAKSSCAAKQVLDRLRSIPRLECRKQSEEFAVVRFEAELDALDALILLGDSEGERLAALIQARHCLGEAGKLFVRFGEVSAAQSIATLAQSLKADLDVSEVVAKKASLV